MTFLTTATFKAVTIQPPHEVVTGRLTYYNDVIDEATLSSAGSSYAVSIYSLRIVMSHTDANGNQIAEGDELIYKPNIEDDPPARVGYFPEYNGFYMHDRDEHISIDKHVSNSWVVVGDAE